MERSTQSVILAVLQNRSVFLQELEAQTVELREMHVEETAAADARRDHIKATISATAQEMSDIQMHEHQTTRQEVAQHAAITVASLRIDIDKQSDEIKDLIKVTNRAKTIKEKRKLKEKTNAATASLIAMDLIYDSLVVCARFYNSTAGTRTDLLSRHYLQKQIQAELSRPGKLLHTKRLRIPIAISRFKMKRRLFWRLMRLLRKPLPRRENRPRKELRKRKLRGKRRLRKRKRKS